MKQLEKTREFFKLEAARYKDSSPEHRRAFNEIMEKGIRTAEARVHIAGLPYEKISGGEVELANHALERLNRIRRGFGSEPVCPNLEEDVRLLGPEEYDKATDKFGPTRSSGLWIPELGIAFIRREPERILETAERFEPATLTHELTHLAQSFTDAPGLMRMVDEGLTETTSREIIKSSGRIEPSYHYQKEVELIAHVRAREPETYEELQRKVFTNQFSEAAYRFYRMLIELSFEMPNFKKPEADKFLEALRNKEGKAGAPAPTPRAGTNGDMERLADATIILIALNRSHETAADGTSPQKD